MTGRRFKHTRIYEQVVEEVKELISSGELGQGDPLPPERQLMDEMGVSRSSLREAFRVLELMGLIESIPGKGRFVRKPRSDAGDGRDMPLEDEAILELMEARRVLDPKIAGAAAMHALPSDLTKLRRKKRLISCLWRARSASPDLRSTGIPWSANTSPLQGNIKGCLSTRSGICLMKWKP